MVKNKLIQNGKRKKRLLLFHESVHVGEIRLFESMRKDNEYRYSSQEKDNGYI